jgi:hypothetical protein
MILYELFGLGFKWANWVMEVGFLESKDKKSMYKLLDG